MGRNVSIIVFVGLPGGGKTTVCQRFMQIQNIAHSESYIHICYDQLISVSKLDTTVENAWKMERQQILEDIRRIVGELQSQSDSSAVQSSSKSKIEHLFCDVVDKDVVILIDDNMYYRSMRYPYVQICREFHCGYGQIIMNPPLQFCLKNNSMRSGKERINDEIIERMASKLQLPQENWENNSLTIDNNFEDINWIISSVNSVINYAKENSLSPVINEEYQNMAEESRRQSIQCHKTRMDLLLREVVSQIQKASKLNGSKLSQARKLYLEKLRTGEISDESSNDYEIVKDKLVQLYSELD